MPSTIGLDILAVTNPDGATAGIRQYLSGVDPNRNWGGPDWVSDAYDSNGVFKRGLGGPEPFSEQETRALADWMLQNRPIFTINYLSAGGLLFGVADMSTAKVTGTPAEPAITATVLEKLLRAMTGRLARGISNRAIRDIVGDGRIAPFPAQSWATGAFRSKAARREDETLVSLWAGQSAALATRETAADVFDELRAGIPSNL